MSKVDSAIAKIKQKLTGEPLFVVGISNQGVVAVELARRVEVVGMWIASGVPAEATARAPLHDVAAVGFNMLATEFLCQCLQGSCISAIRKRN